mgnify:CR=1 FL=1
MTMTEKKHAIKPYPLGAHVEDGAIRCAYASGKKDCGILIYDRKSGKKTHRVPFRQEERMGNVYCKYLELEPENVGYQFYEGERTVPDLHAQGFLRKPAYGKIRKPADRIAVFPNEDFDWEQDMHPMLPYEDSTCYCLHVRGFTMHASSQVTHRGTFAGVVEKLDYLQEIGMTTVEFQPVYEFDETPEKTVPKTSGELAAVAGEKNGEGKLPGYRVLNYWGYREGFYYAPKAAYAAGEDPAEEFRLMVKEFHKRKMEVILQKAVELGAAGVIPVATRNAVVKLDAKKAEAKIRRWQAIAESAAKQSKRSYIPQVGPVMSLKEAFSYIEEQKFDLRMIPYELEKGMDGTKTVLEALAPGQQVAVFIGPEGGFDEEEIQLALKMGVKPVSLGKRILRTETAGPAILALLMMKLEGAF